MCVVRSFDFALCVDPSSLRPWPTNAVAAAGERCQGFFANDAPANAAEREGGAEVGGGKIMMLSDIHLYAPRKTCNQEL